MRLPLALFPLILAACSSDPDPAPGGLTADDQQQLNEAAEMLDAYAVDLEEVTNSSGNEAQP
jgi:hypothetical protein